MHRYPLVIASKYNIPFLMNVQGQGENIKGEIYSVNRQKLLHLDVLEDYPKLYTRREESIAVSTDGLSPKGVELLKVQSSIFLKGLLQTCI